MNLAVSSVAFKDVEETRDFYVELNIPIELGVNLDKGQLDFLDKAKVKARSVHVPCPKSFMLPNFAAFDESVLNSSREIFLESCRTAFRFGCNIVSLHPGYCTDALMPTEPEEREKSLQRTTGRSQTVVEPSYVFEKNYMLHFEALERNLREITKEIKNFGLKLACENLNPKYFYMVQTPSEIKRLMDIDSVNICLDLGHLWISSLVHGFEFYSSVEELVSTGKVIEIHASNNDSSVGKYNDAHDHLYHGSIDYRRVLKILQKFDREDLLFTIEVKHDPRSDLLFLKESGFLK